MRRALPVILIPLVCAAPVAPADIVVGGGCTLPDAITAANSDAPVGSCAAGGGPDTVVLTGNVELTAVDNGVNGLPRIESSIVVEGGGFRISRSDTAPPFRIFEVNAAGSLELRDVTLANGSCPGCSGGALFLLNGSTEIVGSRLVRNSADFVGGGVASSGGDLILTNSSVAGNSSPFGGAGVYQFYGTMTISGSTIANNNGDGVEVGFYTFAGTTIVNSTISGNTDRGITMGVYSSGGLLANSTVSGNQGFNSISVYDGAMVVRDSIITNGSGYVDCSGTIDGGGNFDDDGSCGGQPITGLDPALRRNGGPTLTHALLAGSSAIDSISDCPIGTDQRGFGRSASCDGGAFEFGAFDFDLRGTCPGRMTIRVDFLEPGATVGVFQGPTEGVSQVVGGACDGTELRITDPVLRGAIMADATGRGAKTLNLLESDCGRFLQGVGLTGCSSSVVQQTGCPGGKASCCAAGDRYEDLLDGTVLDCNTDLVWLRDASCSDLPLTDADGLATWQDANAAAAALGDGVCGLTDGSSAGDWRLATGAELCSGYVGQALFPCEVIWGSDSLIDSSVGPPTVVNRAGDGVWTEGDPFSGVLSGPYWSADDFGSQGVFGDLSDGDINFQQKVRLLGVWPVRSN